MKTIDVNISQIGAGDTIVHNNALTTVSEKDIRRSEFMGVTIFGDSYHAGYKKVIKVIEL